ncbi:MAG: SIR2 family protein [Planctomycetota bacterium]|jgi:hypothetical protein
MSERQTVYLLGAGFSQCVKDWHGLKPPLRTNFFQIVLKTEKYQAKHYSEKLASVYEYIKRYWKKSKEDLLKEPLDLEECFTFLELQLDEANERGDGEEAKRLISIRFLLKTLLAKFLSEFVVIPRDSERFLRGGVDTDTDLLRCFARRLHDQKHIVITFNYDCFLEDAIASVSGLNKQMVDSMPMPPTANGDVAAEELALSWCNWNLPLAYGFKFDEVTLQRPGPSQVVNGQRFYGHVENQLYDWKILKLHGSLNWFQYVQAMIADMASHSPEFPIHKGGDILLGSSLFDFNMSPMQDGWFVDPLIITPVLYKDVYYKRKPFPELWNQAKSHLARCSRLIVIGYSFGATDFSVRKLLLEAFAENELDELVVVDPDTSVVKTVKQLVHFDKPVFVCHDVEEFLKL